MANKAYKHKYKERYSVRKFYITRRLLFIDWNQHTHTEKIPMGICTVCLKEEHAHDVNLGLKNEG